MLVFLSLYVIRVIKIPNIWDRFLGMSLISTKAVILIIIAASFNEITYILDLAIAGVLLGFICTSFSAHFLMERKKRGKRT
jgi:multisubunit Na+/H+ antiporter MnhF subunit